MKVNVKAEGYSCKEALRKLYIAMERDCRFDRTKESGVTQEIHALPGGRQELQITPQDKGVRPTVSLALRADQSGRQVEIGSVKGVIVEDG